MNKILSPKFCLSITLLLAFSLYGFAQEPNTSENGTTDPIGSQNSEVKTNTPVDDNKEPEHEDSEATINSGNTSWMITATALVLFMTLPGLALFYGGLVQSKNVLSVLMQCFAIACLAFYYGSFAATAFP